MSAESLKSPCNEYSRRYTNPADTSQDRKRPLFPNTRVPDLVFSRLTPIDLNLVKEKISEIISNFQFGEALTPVGFLCGEEIAPVVDRGPAGFDVVDSYFYEDTWSFLSRYHLLF